MNDQILKLCRRLDKFTFDEILLISEVDSEDLKPILNSFLLANKLCLNKGIYTYNKSNPENISDSVMNYYPEHIVDFIIKSYCAEVPAHKVAFQIDMAAEQVLKFYRYFRSRIYEEQYKRLEKYYIEKPQFAKHPTFLGKVANLYMYENQVFVSAKPFISEEEHLAKNDRAEYKKIYYYLTRELTHNSVLKNMHHKIAEAIWKRNKDFEERFFILSNLLV